MTETAQQYAQRILNDLGTLDPLEALESTASQLEELTRTLITKGLQNKPLPDKWTAVQILAHLAEAEIVWAYRFRKVLGANGQPIEGYDQNEWVKNSGYLQSDPHLALSVFQILRKANISLLRSLTLEQRTFFGIHSQRGKESIETMMKMMAGHDINHLRQMQAIEQSF